MSTTCTLDTEGLAAGRARAHEHLSRPTTCCALKTYDGKRKARLEKMVAQSTDGQVGAKDARRWISERRPKTHRTFPELVDMRIRRRPSAAGKPWHKLGPDDREEDRPSSPRHRRRSRAGTFAKSSYTLSADQFITWLTEGGGLVDFVDAQLDGLERSPAWTEKTEWAEVTRRIWHCSEKLWTPTPATVESLYETQKARQP